MAKRSKARVLVAGAGPCGLLTALRLEQNGIRTEIVDSSWRAGQRSYATGLHPRSQALLDELGFLDELSGHAIDTLAYYRGHELADEIDLGTQKLSHPRILVVSQSRLEQALVDRLKSEFKRKVEWNHRVTRATQNEDSVTVSMDRLGRESTGYATAGVESAIEKTLEREYDVVIGADGHNSAVRRSVDANWTEAGAAETYAIFEVIASGDPDSKLRVVFTGARANVLWPLTDGRWRWAFELDPQTKPDVREKKRLSFELDETVLENAQQRLDQLVAERAPWFAGWAGEIVWSATIRFERRLAQPFGANRIWLTGDAAHVTTPIGIQSMNRGLEEASELGWRVPRFLEQQRGDLLDEYGAEQSRVWRVLQGLERPLLATGSAPEWLAAQKHRLRNCIPATGHLLDRLVAQLGLESG